MNLLDRINRVINDPLFEEVLVSRGISLGAFKMDMELWFHDQELDQLPEAFRAAIATVETKLTKGVLWPDPEPIPAHPSHSIGVGGVTPPPASFDCSKPKESSDVVSYEQRKDLAATSVICSVQEVAALMDELSHWKELVEFWRGRAVLAENKVEDLTEKVLALSPPTNPPSSQ